MSLIEELFEYHYAQRALVAALAAGGVCSLIGVFVVLRRMAFIGSGIAHSALGGVALGVFTGLNPVLAAIVVAMAVAFLIGWISRRGKIFEDTAIGILTAFSMALALVLLSLMGRYNQDIFGFLFGSILAVSWGDMISVLVLALGVLCLVAAFYKEFVFMAFDEEVAKAGGVPTGFLYYLLLGLIAASIVVSLKIVGILLIEALIVIPAATAELLARSFRAMMVISMIVGLASALLGLMFSYSLNLPPGASIVIVSAGFFALAFIGKQLRFSKT